MKKISPFLIGSALLLLAASHLQLRSKVGKISQRVNNMYLEREMQGQVDPRDFHALKAELEAAQRKISGLEDDVLTLAEDMERLARSR